MAGRGLVRNLGLAVVFGAMLAGPALGYQTPGANNGATKTYQSGLTGGISGSGTNFIVQAPNSTIGAVGGPTAPMFTPNIATTTNGVRLDGNLGGCGNVPLNGTTITCANRGTLTIVFSQPVRDPVLHFSGLGGRFENLVGGTLSRRIGFTQQLNLDSAQSGGATLTRLSGTANFVVNGGLSVDKDVVNGDVSCSAEQAGCGSVRVNGTVTQLVFNINMRARVTFNDGRTPEPATTTTEMIDAITMTMTVDEDFGDAPASYDPVQAASHVVGDLTIGPTITADATNILAPTTSPLASPNADADQDDFVWPQLAPGQVLAMEVPLFGASRPGVLCGWVDYNANGVFSADEGSCQSFAAGASSVTLNLTVPANAVTGTRVGRLRAAYGSVLTTGTPTGRVQSGEVEDALVTLQAEADLEILKTVDDPTPTVGEDVTFTVTVNNLGPSTAEAVVVTDALPSGYTFVSATPSVGSYTPPTWTIGDMAAGATATLQIVATVNADGDYTNVATVTSDTEDPEPGNNTAEASTTPVNAIVAVDDAFGSANGLDGDPDVGNVFDNDTLNGQPVDPADVSATLVGPLPPELTFDPATGVVGVNPGTPAGSYSFEYEICEILNPDNCDTATVTVVVAAPEIVANDDSFGPVNGADGGTTPSVLDNDTLNGQPVDPADITLTPVSVPPGLTLNPDGSITVAPGTPAGSYEVEYEICEILNPDNCDTAIATVVVAAPEIVATDDSFGPVNGADGDPNVGNVFDNDTLNGQPVDPADVSATLVGPLPPELTFDPATGVVGVNPGTPAGSYSFEYEICEILNPDNCDTATVTVVVAAPEIVANDDSFGPVNGADGGTTPSVLENDTLNGQPVDPADITLTPVSVPPGLTLNPDGTITVAPGTPAGSYEVEYQICEILNPDNCDTAIATVVVVAPEIVANDDSFGPVNGADGDPNVGNVFDNDTLNGQPVDPADVSATLVGPLPPELTFDPATGVVGVNPGTPAGSYSFEYEICEILNPDNCDTATVTVVVAAPEIVANDDDYSATPINGADGGTTPSVLDNDTLNGQPVDPADITLTPVSVPPGLTLNPDGSITVAPGTPAGSYEVEYQICEILNPDNCDTAIAIVLVDLPEIVANDNDFTDTPVGGADGGTTPSVLENDTLNGQPVDPADITLTPVSLPDGFVLNPDGTITVPPDTPAGSYEVVYQICEILNPDNCDTATATVLVQAPEIVANDDSFGPVNGADGDPNVGNVFDNDSLNGEPVNPEDITAVVVGELPPELSFDPVTGLVGVNPGTPAGSYSFDYQICEILNPDNCDIATVTVVVVAPEILAIDDNFGPIEGLDGNPNIGNVFQGDTLNGQPVSPEDITATVVGELPPELIFDPETGVVGISPGAPAGTYTFTYQICEIANPDNCATATVTVEVVAATIEAVDDEYGPVDGVDGNPDLGSVFDNDSIGGRPVTPEDVFASVVGELPAELSFDPATGTVGVNPGSEAGEYSFSYRICERINPDNCATATVTVTVTQRASELRLSKQAAQREVKVGDLVRYTVVAENVGDSPVANATLVDTVPAGFSYVEGSLSVHDADNAGAIGGTQPLRITGIDVGVGEKATIVYFLRVGAGVGHGSHVNRVSAIDEDGNPISNEASAEVQVVADPLFEDSLILGTVFHDRDGDGWQAPAKATGVRMRGGFAPAAYVAGSTTIDRGDGPQAVADASAPLLQGIELGTVDGHVTGHNPPARRHIVIRQTLSEPHFTDDFVLTTAEGTTVRMDAAGQTTVQRSADAAGGRNAQDLHVERVVGVSAEGYSVAYVVSNQGSDERGIPGVRVATVEGIIMETDVYGRFHLAGVHGGDWARGRNFILKVDPATLPRGTTFSTENPLVRRITPGLPVRFDFGVKLPEQQIPGGREEVSIELGEILFAPGSAEVDARHEARIEQIAAQLREYGGGRIAIKATATGEALAYRRARAVEAALAQHLDATLAARTTFEVAGEVVDAGPLVSLGEVVTLGTVLFDTDRSTIRPQYRPLLREIAQTLAQHEHSVVAIVGRADLRGPVDYNARLGLQRAQAVYEALVAELPPEARRQVRVDVSDDVNTPTGLDNRQGP